MPAQIASLILPLGVFVVFYFLLIRPQQKKDKKIKEMRNNLKVGEQIITIGGIHGKVIKIKDDVITIEVGSDKLKLTMAKWSIGTVVSQDKSL
ncbi:preprotein translocase subunit YajC [Alkaliphilus sp. MSJ-5]|uniref:Preprotein translocase subunit YajC n=1 Tax=Alkaliphilus flagellatus TaxID=2841507 RepID=A0ABS6G613_9FIRM|nr:preprotein translocase subunit YajC [Alkaliphilus flagellatus]MBU5677819.1 preprotein translocase subunit YajC [Alkaliphilus flagellatus]